MATVITTKHSSSPEHHELKTQESSQDTVILTQPLDEEDLHESPVSEEERPTKLTKTVSFDVSMLEYRIPLRRFPPLSPSDTIIGTVDTPYHARTIFVPDTDIVLVHRMKHLSDKHAITIDRKNVFLQQGQRGCNPAAISMLSADMGGKILTQEMRRTNITSDYLEEVYIKRKQDSHLSFILFQDTPLKESSSSKNYWRTEELAFCTSNIPKRGVMSLLSTPLEMALSHSEIPITDG